MTHSAATVCVRKFTFNTKQAFTIEVGQYYMRFYKDGAAVLAPGTEFPFLLETPYMGEHVMELVFREINDVVYITHWNYQVRKLIRVADDIWTIEDLEFENPPFRDENLTSQTMTPSATSGTGVTITSSAAFFQSGHVGGYLKIGHRRTSQSVEIEEITANGNSSTILIYGEWNLRTYGIWNADIYLESYDTAASAWIVVRKFEGRQDRNVDNTGKTTERLEMRIRIANFTANVAEDEDSAVPDPGRVVLEASEYIIYGVAKITGVTSGTVATADVITQFYGTTASTNWSEGAWSPLRGWPWTVAFHSGRLVFGGSNTYPTGLWFSASEDYENFERSSDDDASIFVELAGEESNEIQWIASMDDFIVGTSGSEWVITSNSAVKGITPSSLQAKIRSYFGSEYISPILLTNVLIFVQRKGHRLIEWTWDGTEAKGTNLTLMSSHVGNGGIHQISYTGDPIPIIWVVNGDGYLCGLTYDREQQVLAWHLHTTGNEETPTNTLFESVSCCYGKAGADDEVWVIVNRDGIRSVERFRPTHWTEIEDAFFVDSGLTYSGSPLNAFTGLTHLVGQTIAILADGVPYTAVVNSEGGFSLPTGVTASKVHAGLPYTSTFKPMRLDVDGVLGPHVGKNKSIKQIRARVADTCGLRWKCDGYTYDKPVTSWTLESKDVPIDAVTGYSSDPEIELQQVYPLPFILEGLVLHFEVTGKL